MADVEVATNQELDEQLRTGVREMFTDAVGQHVERRSLPVGRLLPGQTLLQFWHLDFPIQGPDYGQPIVTDLLMQMMSVRRLSPAAANALGLRIHTTLPKALGQNGQVMAAMLIARCRQAIVEPEAFPALLDDAELRVAAAAYRRNQKGFEIAGGALAVAKAAPPIAGNNIGRNTNLPTWLRALGRGLQSLEVNLRRSIPPDARMLRLPAFGFNRGKPFKVGALLVLQSYIAWIVGTGALQNKRRADAYNTEMLHRGLVP